MMTIGGNSAAQIQSIVDRVERLEDDKKAIASDIKDIYAEAKGNGFDVPALRAIVKIRREDSEKRKARESLIETYMHALGMLSDLPLGQAAIEQAKAAM